jgi:hypothetical protein
MPTAEDGLTLPPLYPPKPFSEDRLDMLSIPSPGRIVINTEIRGGGPQGRRKEETSFRKMKAASTYDFGSGDSV